MAMSAGKAMLRTAADTAGGRAINAPTEELKGLLARIARAERDRVLHQARIQDCYKLTQPWKHLFNAITAASDQLDDIYDSTGLNVVEDFAADMNQTFTPTKSRWVDMQPPKTFDAGDLNIIKDKLAQYQEVLFSEMQRSNLYQALQEAYPDLGVGTMVLFIQDRDINEPIHCQATPLTELLLERDPWGGVGGAWRKWRRRYTEIDTLWPKADWAGSGITKPTDVDERDGEVIDGVYRDWSDLTTEKWCYRVLLESKIIYSEDYTGSGSCPLIVARWSRDSLTAWGVGPTYRSLPDMKTLNHVRYLDLKNYDKHVDPVQSYEDDGVVNVDHGVNPGDWIPRAVGSKAPEAVESATRLDVRMVQVDELRSAIRRAHYQDEPDQLGKTPPSATQWADEAARRMRRMGTPATNLVIELQYPLVRRFAYLLGKRGTLPKVELNGTQVALTPISPLLRAQEQEEVVRADRFCELIAARFGPQILNLIVDQFTYAAFLAEKMGIRVDILRKQADLQNTIKQLGPVLGQVGGQAGATPPAPGAIPT